MSDHEKGGENMVRESGKIVRPSNDAGSITGSSLDSLREYGIDVTPLEAGYKSKDAIIKYGQQLRNMRNSTGMNQHALAKAAGMAQPDISRLEKGVGKVGPSVSTMSRLANACGYEFSVSLEQISSSAKENTALYAADEESTAEGPMVTLMYYGKNGQPISRKVVSKKETLRGKPIKFIRGRKRITGILVDTRTHRIREDNVKEDYFSSNNRTTSGAYTNKLLTKKTLLKT